MPCGLEGVSEMHTWRFRAIHVKFHIISNLERLHLAVTSCLLKGPCQDFRLKAILEKIMALIQEKSIESANS